MPIYAMPSQELRKLWYEWIDLYSVLSTAKSNKLQTPAAPFFSACSKVKSKSRIMLVGKATAGDWCLKEYHGSVKQSRAAVIRDRMHHNRWVVQHENNRSPFWQLADRFASFNGELDRDGIIWSNICKIGSRVRNPEGLLLSAQADLAERTLRAEIKEYKPKVVVFVTGSNDIMDRILTRTMGVPIGSWVRSGKHDSSSMVHGVWWTDTKPIALWTRHPQGAKAHEIEYWVEKLRELGKL